MKTIKKSLAVFLALIMALSLAVPAFAAEDYEYNQTCPTIYLNGLMGSTVYKDVNNPVEKVSFPATEKFTAMLEDETIPDLIEYSIDRNFDKLAKNVSESLNVVFDGWFNNPDGTAMGNSGVIMEYPAANTITNKSFLRFWYDWRGDPIVIAEDLHNFIEYVKESSGSDKVALACHSLGSVMVLSYISIYGYEDIYGIVFDSASMEGITYVGELLSGKVEINGDSLRMFFKLLLPEDQYNELIVNSLEILELAGVTNIISESVNSLIDKLAPVIFEETLIPMFAYWLSIWSMVPDEMVEDSINFIFNEHCKDKDLSVLRGKIEDYNTRVRAGRRNTLINFHTEDRRIAVISRYGLVSVPINPSWNVMSDTVVDTKSTSLGATTALVGEILSESYLEGKDMKYISPDKTVDASTCLFPEQTFFIKNIMHSETSFTMAYHLPLLFGEEEATCDNFILSRFTMYNADEEKTEDDNSEPTPEVKRSPLAILMRFLTAVMNFFRNLIGKK